MNLSAGGSEHRTSALKVVGRAGAPPSRTAELPTTVSCGHMLRIGPGNVTTTGGGYIMTLEVPQDTTQGSLQLVATGCGHCTSYSWKHCPVSRAPPDDIWEKWWQTCRTEWRPQECFTKCFHPALCPSSHRPLHLRKDSCSSLLFLQGE